MRLLNFCCIALQLGEAFKSKEDIVIAKIDATANELEHTKIENFPTIKLYTKGDNEVTYFNLKYVYPNNANI